MSLTLGAAAIFPLAGAANAALLSIALGVQAALRRSRAGLCGAGFLAGAAVAVVVITLDHASAPGGWFLPLLEGALTLGGGALFALFVAALIGVRVEARLMFAPMAAFVLAALIAPGVVLDQVSVEWLVLAQAGFTVFAAWLVWRARTQDGRLAAGRRTIALMAVAAVACIHAAQLVRTIWSDAEFLRDVVPYVTASIFFVLAGLVYLGARAAALEPIMSAQPAAPDALALAARLDAAMASALRRPDLTLAEVSAAAGVSHQAAAKALLSAHGVTFKEQLLRLRVREAKRLLRDPAEQRTSMEAIGLLAGFGSRSAFYKAFRDQTGVSPAVFRAESCPET